MSGMFSEQILHVLRDLFVAAIVLFAFKTAREAAEKNGRLDALWKGWAWSIGLALFGAATLGQPSCDDPGDGLHGGCEQYADDGYNPTTDQRLARLLYLTLLFGAPVTYGAMTARRFGADPWRKSKAPATMGDPKA